MTNQIQEYAMKNAEASVRMEGFNITPKMKQCCQQVLNGKTTTSECLQQFLKEQAVRVVK